MKMPTLARTVVGEPVVVHDIGDDGSRALAEFSRPITAVNIAQRNQRCVERHHCGRHSVLLSEEPVLHREPLVTGPGVHILRWIHHASLDLILKLWPLHRKRKREVDSFLIVYLLLVHVL